MKKSDYALLENYMLSCMSDCAHDREHIYRVLYTALDIAGYEEGVDTGLLIAACLLHDIGRPEQYENPALCHAATGAKKAHAFLTKNGYSEDFARRTADCIHTHRYRAANPPQSIEAKILFDADKLEAAGALGIARTLLYCGQMNEPLYRLDKNGEVSDGSADSSPSFFSEYKFKLEGLYTRFYTKRGTELARQRQQAAAVFYEKTLQEIKAACRMKAKLFAELLQ
ncbi:MAG: HD domain-containing protein [Provencibacterium sp.]|jgi:uncharacterized protein|nr:HD domain-containing protein [Provencibacterium sp.]